MQIQHIPSHTNLVADTLSQLADLVTSIVVDSKLLRKVCGYQKATAGQLQLWLKHLEDHGGFGFCILDSFVCRACSKKGYTIVIPKDKEFHQKLLCLHHNLPLAGHLGVFRLVKALSSQYYWRGM